MDELRKNKMEHNTKEQNGALYILVQSSKCCANDIRPVLMVEPD